MNEPIKITPEEIQTFNDIKLNIQKTMFGLGELYLEKMELDHLYEELASKEKKLREDILKVKQEELSLMDKMLEKYGEGNLSLDTGTFIPRDKK